MIRVAMLCTFVAASLTSGTAQPVWIGCLNDGTANGSSGCNTVTNSVPGGKRGRTISTRNGHQDDVIIVATNGTDSSGCGMIDMPCRTIRFAVLVACSFPTGPPPKVLVLGGVGATGLFTESSTVAFNTSLVIVGVPVDGATPIVNLSSTVIDGNVSTSVNATGFRGTLPPNGTLSLENMALVSSRVQAGDTSESNDGERINGGAALAVLCMSGCAVRLSNVTFMGNTVNLERRATYGYDDDERHCKARMGGGAVLVAHNASSLTPQEPIILTIQSSVFTENASPG